MESNKALQIWNDLPTWAKGTIAVGGIAIVYFAARGIWKRIKLNIDKQQDLRVQYESKQELKDLERQGVKRTLPDSQLEVFCQKLVEAFDGCGTTEESVFKVFESISNQADLLALISKYGIRKYDACNWQFNFGDNEFTLPRAMESELDSTDMKKVNSILSKKGISYRF